MNAHYWIDKETCRVGFNQIWYSAVGIHYSFVWLGTRGWLSRTRVAGISGGWQMTGETEIILVDPPPSSLTGWPTVMTPVWLQVWHDCPRHILGWQETSYWRRWLVAEAPAQQSMAGHDPLCRHWRQSAKLIDGVWDDRRIFGEMAEWSCFGHETYHLMASWYVQGSVGAAI